MRKPYVIGFMGYAGVGKSTAAKALQAAYKDIEIASFAGPLKEAVQQLFLFSDEQVYGSKEQKEAVDERWGISPRRVLQIVGTDCLRNMIDPKFHVKRMSSYLQQCRSKLVIIDDIRFADEAELVNQYGKCFYIGRPGYPKDDIRHASEYPPKHLASGYTILNSSDTVEDFKYQLICYNDYINDLIRGALNETR